MLFGFPQLHADVRAQLSDLALEICKFPFCFLDSVFNHQEKKKILCFVKMENIFILLPSQKQHQMETHLKFLHA